MTAANPTAVYLMQAWLFHESFWTYDRVQAFLSSVPIGSMIILDLNSEDGPVWNLYDSFFGHSWIWNRYVQPGGWQRRTSRARRVPPFFYAAGCLPHAMRGIRQSRALCRAAAPTA